MLAGGTKIGIEALQRGLEGMLISVAAMGLNYPWIKFCQENDPLRLMFSPPNGSRSEQSIQMFKIILFKDDYDQNKIDLKSKLAY